MADREVSGRGRKRGRKSRTSNPPPTAADLFDSLFQTQEEPKKVNSKNATSVAKQNDTVEPSTNSESFPDSQSSGENSNAHSASEDEEPCVLMSFAGQDEEASPEASPAKRARTRRENTPPQAEVQESPLPTPDDDEQAEARNVEDDASSQSDSGAAERDSGLASLGVSKDVEDSIRAEIENMLANNRFRAMNGNTEDDEDMVNGQFSLEQDIVLIEPKSKKRCKFLIRQQEDQTPPFTRDYRCSRCAWSTTRMSNMIHHYRKCSE